MDNEQLRAFRLTDYLVDAPDGKLLLKVDEPNEALAGLLRSRGAAGAARWACRRSFKFGIDERLGFLSGFGACTFRALSFCGSFGPWNGD